MIRSILRISEEKLNSLDTHQLTTYDQKLLEDLIEILTPFETATQCIQDDKGVTSSMIVPCIRVLKAKMNTLSQKLSSKFVSALKASVNSRMSHYEECEAFLMASALDPWFKLEWCSSVEYNTLKANFVANVKSVNLEASLDINSQIASTSVDINF